MDALAAEANALGLDLAPGQVDALAGHVDLLLKWNAKLNLTRITTAQELRVKHVLDSMLAVALVPETASTVLDLGSGGGFPGIPWLVGRPELAVTMVDAVQKKVSFLKTALASLRLLQGRAIHARLAGDPSREGLEPASVVTSRAFTSLADFLRLSRAYLAPGGSVVAFLGASVGPEAAHQTAQVEGFEVAELRSVTLPHRLGSRLVIRAVPRGTAPLA
jgi:16S rRNA (guanine527-N7)-methyltransferase